MFPPFTDADYVKAIATHYGAVNEYIADPAVGRGICFFNHWLLQDYLADVFAEGKTTPYSPAQVTSEIRECQEASKRGDRWLPPTTRSQRPTT